MENVRMFVWSTERSFIWREDAIFDARKSHLRYITFSLTLYKFVRFSFLKVIRHVFGFGIEFLESKDIGILGHFIVIDFTKRYSYHTYFSPISTSRFRRFETGCIVRNGEWCIFVNYSVFSALFSSETLYFIRGRHTWHTSTKRYCTIHIHIEIP